MIVKRNLGDIAELTAGVISQRVLADKEDVETGDSVFVLVPKAIHDGELDEEWSECLGSCFSPVLKAWIRGVQAFPLRRVFPLQYLFWTFADKCSNSCCTLRLFYVRDPNAL